MSLSRHVAKLVLLVLFLSLHAEVYAGFEDEPPDLDPYAPAEFRHPITDPNSSRLFFMPTFEVPPQGQATIGTTELVALHGTLSLADFVQVGAAVVPWLPGAVSIGAKVRILRSQDRRAGLAIGGNYTTLDIDAHSNTLNEATTGYVIAGYKSTGAQIHGGLFYIETLEHSNVYFIPSPEPDYSRPNNSKREHALFGVLGLSAPVNRNTSALLEIWGFGDDEDWPIIFPGFRFFEGDTSVEVIVTPIWYDGGDLQFSIPIFNITHHFR